MFLHRCTANPNEYDDPTSTTAVYERTKDYTNALVKAFDNPKLRKEYGIIEDLVVSFRLPQSRNRLQNVDK